MGVNSLPKTVTRQRRDHKRRKGSVVVGHHGECGARERIMGVWGQSPQRGPEPLVKRSGGRNPREAESIVVIGCPTEPANLAHFQKCPLELHYTNKVLNHCRVTDAIQKVFMNMQSHNRIQTFGRHG